MWGVAAHAGWPLRLVSRCAWELSRNKHNRFLVSFASAPGSSPCGRRLWLRRSQSVGREELTLPAATSIRRENLKAIFPIVFLCVLLHLRGGIIEGFKQSCTRQRVSRAAAAKPFTWTPWQGNPCAPAKASVNGGRESKAASRGYSGVGGWSGGGGEGMRARHLEGGRLDGGLGPHVGGEEGVGALERVVRGLR